MRKIPIFVTLFIVSVLSSYGQRTDSSIIMVKAFGGNKFYQNNKNLSMSELVKVMSSDEQALKQIKSAQSSKTLADIIGFAGGFMVGWPVGTAIGGGKPNWTVAAIGSGLVVASIPIYQKVSKLSKSSVDIFNRNQKEGPFNNKTGINVSFTGNTIRLTLSF
jgi:hypothetical protein